MMMKDSRDTLPGAPTKVAQVACLVIFAVLGIALFRLQIAMGDHYKELSEDNYVVQASIRAPRGEITDRNGRVIAASRQSFSICAVPRSILRNTAEMRTLARILEVDEEFIESRLSATASSYRPAAVLRDVDFATLSRVEEMFADLPDVIVVSEPVRSYPGGAHFSHMVGYVGEVTQGEIEASRSEYAPGDFVGKAGLEKEYEAYLRGRPGQKYVKFTLYGSAGPVDLEDLPVKAPRPGMRLVLNADDDLQRLSQRLLTGRRGCIVVLDVRTGGVLALASSPPFDPDLFATGISGTDWETIIKHHGKPLINRAIQSSYPPGSTYKIVTSAAALEGNKVSRHTRYQPCRGSYKYGNRIFSCWRREGHGTADLVEAIAVSCDVYFYQLGERLGLDQLATCSLAWHLETKTGIDLPGEIDGLVPTASYYDSVYGQGKWTRGVMLNLAIGQGELLLTPMELLCFVCAIAGGGTYVTPRCVRTIESEGRIESVVGEAVTLTISETTMDILRMSMLMVVEGPDGTGRAARLPGIKVAGKTGTAQNPHGDDHASFVCFAPYENPEIGLLVMLENAGHGGAVAAPIAGEILAYYFDVSRPGEIAGAR